MFIKYPGKLFLMGEFAIMEAGSVAVVSAVDAFLEIQVEASEDYYIKSSHGVLKGSEVFSNKIMPHVHASLKVLNDFIEIKPFRMEIVSDLEVDGKKVGFGSSGVVVVGVLDSILKFHKVDLTEMQLFKLACLVQLEMNEFSSGGDLAACIYKDTIVYQSYDRSWLQEQDFDTDHLINIAWPQLDIQRLKIEHLIDLRIGWTGIPNATNVSTQSIKHAAYEDPNFYKEWIKKANNITEQFIAGIKIGRYESVKLAVADYRQHMLDLQEWSHTIIETPLLTRLIDATQFAAKISGSGGGDCGIVLLEKGQEPDFEKPWQEAGIKIIKGGTYHEY